MAATASHSRAAVNPSRRPIERELFPEAALNYSFPTSFSSRAM